MNRLSTLFFVLFFVSAFFTDCAESSSRSRRPVSSIRLEPKKKNYVLGDVITINSQTNLKGGQVEKIEISIDGQQISTSNNLTNSSTYKTSDFGLGKHTVKVLVKKSDGLTGENFEEILVVSNHKPVQYSYEIVASYPHNATHFTQGLEFHDNQLYEGTGQEGSSAIYRENLKTGAVTQEKKMENNIFGEGITILNNHIYQLTYKNKIGYIYDLKDFNLIDNWSYKSREGWGLTNDGTSLIMSDGTENICYINPQSFNEIKRIQVCDDRGLVNNLNELEYINGEIWANIWTTDNIVIIDPNTGMVKGKIDLGGLSGSIMQSQRENLDVLNGIAWNPATGKIYVTGKWWPKIFEIRLIKKAS